MTKVEYNTLQDDPIYKQTHADIAENKCNIFKSFSNSQWNLLREKLMASAVVMMREKKTGMPDEEETANNDKEWRRI